MTPGDADTALAVAHRDEWARLVAVLARRFGDLDLAVDAGAAAFREGVRGWPDNGVPPSPGGWLMTTATRKALDHLRRESTRKARYEAAHMLTDPSPAESAGPVEDDRLRLVFICCHPALAMEARVALTLRMVGGLTVAEIARAFLVQDTAMARRITRAKAKITAAHIPYTIPDAEAIRERITGVLAVVFLIFNEGYLASAGEESLRPDLTDEAIRLGRLLRDLLPDDGEVAGLLALMLLTDSRRAARVGSDGDLVILAEQDRGSWDRKLVAEGHALVRECLAAVATGGPPPGRYQILAAINAVHTAAPSSADTDWSQILALYDRLLTLDPSPVVRLNRAVAVGERQGPETALREVAPHAPLIDGDLALAPSRAHLLRRVGRLAEATVAYSRAISLTDNPAERAFLARRRDELAR